MKTPAELSTLAAPPAPPLTVATSGYSRFIAGMRCLESGRQHPWSGVCDAPPPECPGYAEIVYDYPAVATAWRRSWRPPGPGGDSTLWRYAPFLPVVRPPRLTLPVGGTPLWRVEDERGVELLLKDEGCNPSGSMKDRASLLAVAAALVEGREAIAVASTGNAASSLAAAAANAGVRARAFVPRDAPRAKLLQIQMYGAELVRVDGGYAEAFEACRRLCADPAWVNRSTGLNTTTREGKKTCAFEIVEQLGWRVPDWVFTAVGNGNIVSGLWKGFRELRAVGLTEALPRMVAVQSQHCMPVVREAGGGRTAVSGPATQTPLAGSINVPYPQDFVAAVRAIRESAGEAVAVADAEIAAAMRKLASRWGVFAEPAAAASYAGFLRLVAAGRLRPGERAVCVITAHGLKDLEAAGRAVAAGED